MIYGWGAKETTMRKVIQIETDYEGDLYALCDDGTIWLQQGDTWQQQPLIPQTTASTTGM